MRIQRRLPARHKPNRPRRLAAIIPYPPPPHKPVSPLRECGGMPNRERQAWRADDGRGAPPLCAGADACIGPPAGLAVGWCLCVATRSRPQCRAGVHARRLGFAISQGFRGDASIVPPAGLAEGWCLCVATRSRPQCRAGDLARRLGFAISQGFRDDASIVPYGCRARLCRALQDISSAKRQCTPPSAPYGAATVRFAVPASHGAR